MPNIDEDAQRWQDGLSERVGKAVLHWRKKRSLSAVQLADRTASLGYPISRIAITKIETNKRAGKLDTSELIALSAALEVPPALLLFPGVPSGLVEVVPNVETSSIKAVQWFSGEDAQIAGLGCDPSLLMYSRRFEALRQLLVKLETDRAMSILGVENLPMSLEAIDSALTSATIELDTLKARMEPFEMKFDDE